MRKMMTTGAVVAGMLVTMAMGHEECEPAPTTTTTTTTTMVLPATTLPLGVPCLVFGFGQWNEGSPECESAKRAQVGTAVSVERVRVELAPALPPVTRETVRIAFTG